MRNYRELNKLARRKQVEITKVIKQLEKQGVKVVKINPIDINDPR